MNASGTATRRFFGRRQVLSSTSQQATFDVLHTANLAAPLLRRGFTGEHLGPALPALSVLIGAPAVAINSPNHEILAVTDDIEHHHNDARRLSRIVGKELRPHVEALHCAYPSCELSHVVGVPILVSGRIIGTLMAFTFDDGPATIRTMTEVAHWVASQTELAELDQQRDRLARAELRALRAQISPHFIYNALTAVASFIRTDPGRARDLLIEFADFTRYSLRNQGEFTTVSEELRSIERYLVIEKARFGERLTVTLRVAPEVLNVAIPFLVVQPLVENAIRHGIERLAGAGRLSIHAYEEAQECVIVVEDDGAGVDPEHLRVLLNTGGSEGEHIGLINVDERLRAVYGPHAALQIETAVDAGTKVSFRVPKYRPGVRA